MVVSAITNRQQHNTIVCHPHEATGAKFRRGWRPALTLGAAGRFRANPSGVPVRIREAPRLAQMEGWLVMSLQDKIADKAQVLTGKVKEAAGKITNDPALEVEGKVDQGKGHIKQAGEKIKDAAKSIFDA